MLSYYWLLRSTNVYAFVIFYLLCVSEFYPSRFLTSLENSRRVRSVLDGAREFRKSSECSRRRGMLLDYYFRLFWKSVELVRVMLGYSTCLTDVPLGTSGLGVCLNVWPNSCHQRKLAGTLSEEVFPTQFIWKKSKKVYETVYSQISSYRSPESQNCAFPFSFFFLLLSETKNTRHSKFLPISYP